MISVEEARAAVLATARLAPAESVPLDDALGRTLAAPITSRGFLPPFTNSAMDGFAVRTTDLTGTPTVLTVAATVTAGQRPPDTIKPGTCVRVMTGAMLPSNADAVVPIEWTDDPEATPVVITRAPALGQYVRPKGKDVRPGEVLIEGGRVVTPPVVSMLAALGETHVSVRRAPRIAVVVTGDEVVPPEATPRLGQVRDANGPGLVAQIRHGGGEARPLRYAADTMEALRAALDVEGIDALVVAGGVSVGTHDLVAEALRERGFEQVFWRVRQRPGKPLLFGSLGDVPVFGLPGNPVSAAVCFDQYVRPWMATALGHPQPLRERFQAKLGSDVAKGAGLHHVVRGRMAQTAEGPVVTPTGPQDSNLYTSVLNATVLIHLPEALTDPVAGTLVEAERLGWAD